MKKIYFLVIAVCFSISLQAQIINIPDANFKDKLLAADVTNGIAVKTTGGNFKIDANSDGEIQVTEAQSVGKLSIGLSYISSLIGIEYFTNLTSLSCQNNQLADLDLSTCSKLADVDCSMNQLKSLNIVSPVLTRLNCRGNQLIDLDLSMCPVLVHFDCKSNQLTNLDLGANIQLKYFYCEYNQLSALDVTMNVKLYELFCGSNQLTGLNLSNNIALVLLSCDSNKLSDLDLSKQTSLKYLYCDSNQLTTLDLSKNTNLSQLNCCKNQLPGLLDLSHNILLTNIDCSQNLLSSLNIADCTKLVYLRCSLNQLAGWLDLSSNKLLTELYCYSNLLSGINVSQNIVLKRFLCHQNQLTALDVSNATSLIEFWCSSNSLYSLDLSAQKSIGYLVIDDCPNLWFVNFKNGSIENINGLNPNGLSDKNYALSDCPNLKYICADGQQIDSIKQLIAPYNYADCVVGDYCSFTPGGDYYTVTGKAKMDSDQNGCDASDAMVSNLKFNISKGTASDGFMAGNSGNYNIAIGAGSYVITPVLENPSYFSISPTSLSVSFPTQSSPVVQDFCVAANGVHNDLEVSAFPVTPARPGFDAKYKILYKNKGSQTQSGSVNLAFDDAVLDVVNANPIVANQTTNSLSWDFANLAPFETREILVTLNVNSPTETPAVQGGDILHFTTTITNTNDELPVDNVFNLNQTVVNSFDPNDKTCLEGNVVSPSMVGDYVHYLIRFENTGSAEARNIVVKDVIDTTKYDISTLAPLNGSAAFTTRISSTNIVEFIFENINLPFDDANNDGYVAFKIKTRPTLTVGDVFSNTANIYFDYNAPIVTNTATTSIQALKTQDFEFGRYFSLSPNPVKDVLTINGKQDIRLTSVSIYNVLGQLMMVVSNPGNTTDVSNLEAGNYLLKVFSDKGASCAKFIKE